MRVRIAKFNQGRGLSAIAQRLSSPFLILLALARNSNVADFVSECRICGRRELNKSVWPPPVKPEDCTLLETRSFLTPEELERFRERWDEMYKGA